MANPNPRPFFTEGHTHSAKPRKRKTFSEAALLAAAERKGDGALLFYEELFEVKESEDGSKDYVLKERNDEKIKLSDRINAANAWCKLVFIQPKDEDENAGTQLNIFAFKRIEELEAKLLALENNKSND